MSKFSDKLTALRKGAGLTQQELADRLGVKRSTIGMYESGAREPGFETAEALAELFNIDMNVLLGIETPQNEKKSGEERELMEYLEMLRTRPECRAFLSTIKGASKAEVEENVRFITALRQAKSDED